MENYRNILLGYFIEYKNFVGTIEICDGHYCGHLKDISDFVNYQAQTIEEMFEEYKKAIDDYIELKKELVTCSETLTNSCKYNCMNCICRECEEREFCEFDCSPIGCGH